MNRRDLLKSTLLAAAISGLSRFAFARDDVDKPQEIFKVSFKHGVHAAALHDGSWNLWVRPDPRNKRIRFVRLRLQIATDPEFRSVVSEQSLVAKREATYIVRTNFMPKQQEDLYFRFVVVDSASGKKLDMEQISSVGRLSTPRNT